MNCEALLKQLLLFSGLIIHFKKGIYFVYTIDNECIYSCGSLTSLLHYLLNYINDNLEEFWI